MEIFGLILFCLVATAFAMFTTDFREQRSNNEVALRCRDNTNGEEISNSFFFLGDTRLEDLVAVGRSGPEIRFLLRRDLEGGYSCSNSLQGERSDPIQLVALPNSNEPRSAPPTVYARVGSTATLDCSIQPGKLFRRYLANWYNGSNPSQQYARSSSSSLPPSSTPSRYSINPSTLSLTISNVSLSDSGSMYRCEVGVDTVVQPRRLYYDRTRALNIMLVVYKPPTIISPPESKTISLQLSRQVQYRCVAVGDPAPKITWTHNGRPTTLMTMYHTTQPSPRPDPEGRGSIVTSTLSIFPLDETSTGNVTCTASVPPATLGVATPSSAATARLSVLGGFHEVGVLITQGGDIIFKLTLPAIINVPVNILMVFTDASREKKKDGGNRAASGSAKQSNRTTTASFNSTDAITHIIFRSKVPFNVFRVGVALVSGSVEGPVQNNSRIHDVNFPSLVPTSLLHSQLIVASLVPISFFVLLFLAAIVITIVCHFSRRKKRELDFHRSVVDRHVDVLEILLEKLPQDPSGRVYTQMLQVVERILTIHLDDNSSGQSSLEGDRFEETTTDVDAIDASFPEMSVKSTALIKTLGNVIERGRQNPKLRPHLDRQMSTIILDQPDTPPFPSHSYLFGGNITATGDYTDAGYAGSSSAETKEELELGLKL